MSEAPEQGKKPRWYYGVMSVLTALVILGPFAFPLLWKSPKFNLTFKILLTVVVIALTVYTVVASWHIYEALLRELKTIGSVTS